MLTHVKINFTLNFHSYDKKRHFYIVGIYNTFQITGYQGIRILDNGDSTVCELGTIFGTI